MNPDYVSLFKFANKASQYVNIVKISLTFLFKIFYFPHK